MPINRTQTALIGVNEATLSAVVLDGATLDGAEVDVLGSDAAVGELWLYLVVLASQATGLVKVTFNPQRVSGGNYRKQVPDFSITPVNGTLKVPLGDGPVMSPRWAQAVVTNSGVTAGFQCAVLYEVASFR